MAPLPNSACALRCSCAPNKLHDTPSLESLQKTGAAGMQARTAIDLLFGPPPEDPAYENGWPLAEARLTATHHTTHIVLSGRAHCYCLHAPPACSLQHNIACFAC